jgi:endonuclease/exonuclease/phosphatase family metal-dependent hydrolase
MPEPQRSSARTFARRLAGGRHADLRERLTAHVPYLSELQRPGVPPAESGPDGRFRVATYNVHRWAGVPGGRFYEPDRATAVVDELAADVIALQEALRPFEGADPLAALAERLGFYLAFVCTRLHRRGELGNAVLARWPIAAAFAINLTFGRLEQRAAIAVQLHGRQSPVTVAATHLSLVDRMRQRQVQALLSHPQLASGPVVLLGDMNAWRQRGRAALDLEREFLARHHNRAWPASWPAVRPVLALDRAYARGARLEDLRAHESAAARKGSDHLPVLGTVVLEN